MFMHNDSRTLADCVTVELVLRRCKATQRRSFLQRLSCCPYRHLILRHRLRLEAKSMDPYSPN
jgi:hypothetical protein